MISKTLENELSAYRIGEKVKQLRAERGLRLVAFVRANSSHRPAQDEAQQILDEYGVTTQKESAELLAAAQAQVSGRTLEEIVREEVTRG